LFKEILIAASLVGGSVALHAQAAPTAIRTSSLQVGAGWSSVNTDYLPKRVKGTTVYFDWDFYRHIGVEGEFRYAKDGETNIYEKTYEVGPRYSRTYFQRLSPYAKGLYGRGVFNFTYQDKTTANLAYNLLAFGGGLDYTVLPFLNVRGDYEYQHWFSFPPHGLTPSAITVGAAYRFR
jgi:Outer membrane protein beta-barrel domain